MKNYKIKKPIKIAFLITGFILVNASSVLGCCLGLLLIILTGLNIEVSL